MTPPDFRNATFADLQEHLSGMRKAALEAWLAHGPGTTAQVAERAAMSILTLRPRTTELLQLGFLALAAEQPHPHEGIYRACTASEHQAWLVARQASAIGRQTELALAGGSMKAEG